MDALAKVSVLCAPSKVQNTVTRQYEGHFKRTESLNRFYVDPAAEKKVIKEGCYPEFLRVQSLMETRLSDYVTKPCWLDKIFKIVGWKPAVDLACNPIGSNAVAPLFICAMADALKSRKYLPGKRLMVNPMFKLTKEYKELLEQALRDDPTTRAIFVVPDRPS